MRKALLLVAALVERAIHDANDFFPAEDADEVIDAGHLVEQGIALALSEAAGDDDGADSPLILEGEHFADDAERFLPRRLDEPARVDDDDVGAVRIGH